MTYKWPSWMSTLLWGLVLLALGLVLYKLGALPFVPGGHPAGGRPAGPPISEAARGLQNRGSSAQPLQTLPALLGDLWFITSSITAVRWLQALARQPKTAVSRARAAA